MCVCARVCDRERERESWVKRVPAEMASKRRRESPLATRIELYRSRKPARPQLQTINGLHRMLRIKLHTVWEIASTSCLASQSLADSWERKSNFVDAECRTTS